MKNMMEFLLTDNDRVPDRPVPVTPLRRDFRTGAGNAIHLAWLGHSTVLIEMEGVVILTDPMLAGRASPFSFAGPKRFDVTHTIAVSDLPDVIDAVVISHDHYDHLDYETILGIKDRVGRFFVPLGVGAHLERWGVSPDDVTELDWWDEHRFRGITFAATPSRHFSGRGIKRNKTLWCSWVLAGADRRIFFSGDSGYFEGFRRIGERYGPFDLTMMECGAYDENWPHVHMNPEDTVRAHGDLGGDVLMPIHWAQFNLSLHGWTEPAERLMAASSANGVKCITPPIGSRFSVPSVLSEERWWRTAMTPAR